LPTRGQVATFPIDHIQPRTAGGTTDLSNLALTCPHCNAHKWTAVAGADPETGDSTRFYHPREDVWREHFEWSRERPGELAGKSAIGRSTIAALRINSPDMIELRLLLSEVNLFPEMEEASQ
jgi:hypothetical protein